MATTQATKKPAIKKPAKYTSDHIETQRFPESVRNNAAMYIGGVDAYGMWTVTKELLDNAADEFMAGRNDQVTLFLDKDGSYWVWDAGHGIPQGLKKFKINLNGKEILQKMPTMQAVFGELHTSGKNRSDAYAVSIGTHGIGAKATNATAEFFEVTTFYENQWWSIKFKQGKLVAPVGKTRAPKLPDGTVAKKGTVVHVKPDLTIFNVKSFPPSMAIEWAEIMAYMNPGLRITIQSHKTKKIFFSKIGPKEYIEKRLEKLKVEAEKIMFVHNDDLSDVAVAFANYDGCDLRGMTNSVTNSQGGKHVDSVTGALYEGLKPFIKTKKVAGKVIPAFRELDLKEGLVGLVNAKLHKAQFSSQDKAKLTDDRMGKPFESSIIKVAEKFFKENKALAQRLCERATKLNQLKTQFTLSKKAVADLNRVKRNGLPAKYAGFDNRTKVHDRELFLVEGDSAGGSLKEARLPYQAVLPLRGKILNALKDAKGKAMESEEIINILAGIGYDPKAADPLSKLTVGKIICLADPDPDGPFVGETLIRYKSDSAMDYGTIQIKDLVNQVEPFSVPVWVGGAEQWRPATAELIKNVDKLVAMEIGGHKYKVDENHQFLCVRTPSTRDRISREHNDTLGFIRAKDMHVGDRVYAPLMEQGRRDYDKQDKVTGRGFLAVNKLRIQQLAEPVPVYCLTVPGLHHFMLPSGIVSSNCHINSLLLTLFYKYLPELFERGLVYVSAAPEFYAIHKNQLVSGDTLSLVQKKLKKIGTANAQVNHLKGWGEASANLMKVLAVNPETRRLIKIAAIEKDDHVEFVKLMNDDVEYRRKMLGLPAAAKVTDEDEVPAKKGAAKKTSRAKSSLSEEEGQRKLNQARTHVRKVLKETRSNPKKTSTRTTAANAHKVRKAA